MISHLICLNVIAIVESVVLIGSILREIVVVAKLGQRRILFHIVIVFRFAPLVETYTTRGECFVHRFDCVLQAFERLVALEENRVSVRVLFVFA